MAGPHVRVSTFVAFKLFKSVMSTPGLLPTFGIAYGVMVAIVTTAFAFWLIGLWISRCNRISRDQRERERIHRDDPAQADGNRLGSLSGIALFQPSPAPAESRNNQEPAQTRAQIHEHSSELPKQHRDGRKPRHNVAFQDQNRDGKHSSHAHQHTNQTSIELPLTQTTLQMVNGLADNIVTDVDPATVLSKSSGTNNSRSLRRANSYRVRVKTKEVIARELKADRKRRNSDGSEQRENVRNGPRGMDTGTPAGKLNDGSKRTTLGRKGGKTTINTAVGDYSSLSTRNTGDNYTSLGIAPAPPDLSRDSPLKSDVSKKAAVSILSPDTPSPKSPKETRTHLALKRLLPLTPPQQEEQDRSKYENDADAVYQEIADHEASDIKEVELQKTDGYMKFIKTSDNSDYARISEVLKDNDGYLVPTPH